MSFSNKIESDNDMLTKTSRMYDEKAAEVNYLNEALTSAVHDPNSVGQEDKIIDYFQTIGSSNPKHLKKFKQYFKNKHGGVPKWL